MLNLRTQPLCRIKPQRQCFECFNLLAGLPCLVAQSQRICLQCRRWRFDPWVRKILWRRKWQPSPVFLPGKSCGQRSLGVYSPWGHKRLEHNLLTKQRSFGCASCASLVSLAVKNLPAIAVSHKTCRFDLWVRKIPWRREWQPTPVFLPGESQGQKSRSLGGSKGSDTTEVT